MIIILGERLKMFGSIKIDCIFWILLLDVKSDVCEKLSISYGNV